MAILKKISPRLLLIASFAIAIGIRLVRVQDVEINVDTSGYIASALSVSHYPDTLWRLLNYTDSRPLAVLPLYLLRLCGVPLSYASAELTALILWLASLWITFLTLRFFISDLIAAVLTAGTALFLGSTTSGEILPYNAESISVLMLALSTYLYILLSRTAYNSGVLVLAQGLLLGLLPYAKFQNIPMGLLIAGAMLAGLCRNRRYKSAVLFLLAGIIPTLLINIGYFIKGALSEFWINYFWSYLEYSFSTQFSPIPLADRFDPVRAVAFLISDPHMGFFAGGVLIASATGIILLLAFKTTLTKFQSAMCGFAALMALASVYAILQAGTYFGHYKQYLILPLLLQIAVTAGSVPGFRRWGILIPFFAGTLCQLAYNGLYPLDFSGKKAPETDLRVSELVRAHSQPDDNIVVWGWMPRFYCLTQRPCGYRMSIILHLLLKSELLPVRRAYFLHDISENKPAIILEDTYGRHSLQHPSMLAIYRPIRHFPEISHYVQQNYTLLTTLDGLAVYKRNAAGQHRSISY